VKRSGFGLVECLLKGNTMSGAIGLTVVTGRGSVSEGQAHGSKFMGHGAKGRGKWLVASCQGFGSGSGLESELGSGVKGSRVSCQGSRSVLNGQKVMGQRSGVNS